METDLETGNEKAAQDDRDVIQGRDPLKIGTCVGDDFSGLQIDALRERGVSVFQIMGVFLKSGVFRAPPGWLLNRMDGCEVVVHMPFYFHLLHKITAQYLSMFRQLDEYWGELQERTDIIIHCKGIRKPAIHTLNTMRDHLRRYSGTVKNLRLVMENDAGGKDNPAVRLRHISKVRDELKENFPVGFCLDTQHAYAAGEGILRLDVEKADMIHLNAVPRNVRFGGHLDRHSHTALAESKNGTKFVRQILLHSQPGTPVILERLSMPVILRDLNTLKEIQKRCGLK